MNTVMHKAAIKERDAKKWSPVFCQITRPNKELAQIADSGFLRFALVAIAAITGACAEKSAQRDDQPPPPESLSEFGPETETPAEGGAENIRFARCESSLQNPGDPRFERAAAALFGAAAPSADQEVCQTPVYLADFGNGAALVTMTGTPGEGCHACAADLSFHTLAAAGDGFVVLRSFPSVVATGTFQAPGEFKTFQLSNKHAIAIEHGGMFQGYLFGGLSIVLFGDTGPAAITTEPALCLFSSDEGAWIEGRQDPVRIEGEWRVDETGDGLIVTLKKETGGSLTTMISSWRFEDDRLVLDGGDYPEAAGAC